jgi:hypothetical protein
VTIPLTPRTALAIGLAIGERTEDPSSWLPAGAGWTATAAGRIIRRTARRTGITKPTGPHPAACVHHRRAGRRSPTAGRAASRLPR